MDAQFQIEKPTENQKAPALRSNDFYQPENNQLPADYYFQRKIVEIKDLKVVYNAGKLNEARALDGITLDIFEEEYVIFFGPSGCGKSTLLNVMAGLEAPSSGSVLINDQNLHRFSANELAKFHRRTVGMIFQSYNLIPTLNVIDNVILPQIFERVKTTLRKHAGRIYLKKLGLEKYEKRFQHELSGGQQQRVGIARALINNPPIILGDEATGNLDSQAAKNVLEILNMLNIDDKKTIISVTHNPEHLYYADRIFYIRDGRIVKMEINRKKRKEKKEGDAEGIKKKRTELDLLLQAYPDLSSMQLHIMLAPFKAKILAIYLLSQLEPSEIESLEKIITERLLNRLSSEELLQLLNNSIERGGIGLNWQTAVKFRDIIEEVVTKSDYIASEHEHFTQSDVDPITQAVKQIRYSILDKFEGQLNIDQVEALDKGIEYRLLSKISRQEFEEFLDRPFEKGGVGLNRKSARYIARKLELIMLMQFGKS